MDPEQEKQVLPVVKKSKEMIKKMEMGRKIKIYKDKCIRKNTKL